MVRKQKINKYQPLIKWFNISDRKGEGRFERASNPALGEAGGSWGWSWKPGKQTVLNTPSYFTNIIANTLQRNVVSVVCRSVSKEREKYFGLQKYQIC